MIDRKSGKAQHRQMERVPSGAVFDFEIIMDIYEGDDKDEMLKMLEQAFALLEDDYLGGSGTRGYGKVKSNIKLVNQKYTKIYESHYS